MVTTLTERFYSGEFLIRENANLSRDVVVFDNTAGSTDLLVQSGTPFTFDTATVTAQAKAGNTGNGSVSNLQENLVSVQTGTYTIGLTGANGFTVTAPDGTPLSPGVVGTSYLDSIGFTLSAGTTPFAAGDGFTIAIANGSAPVAAIQPGGNTGNGTLSGVEATQSATASIGNYIVTFLAPTTFSVLDPKGAILANGTVGTYYEDRIGFLVTAGSTAFAAGDQFTVGVGFGTGYATFWTGAGGPIAGIIFETDWVPAGGTKAIPAIMRLAEVQQNALVFPPGTTAAQVQTAVSQLRSLNIIAR